MKNVTITLDEQTAVWARVYAARHDTSVSRLIGEMLERRMPEKMAEVRILWKSPLIASDPMVWRKDLDPELKAKLKAFFLAYGTKAEEREKLLDRAQTIKLSSASRAILHPRLKQPMRLVDHLFFAAEHDDHHLARMWELLHLSA